MVIIPTMLYLGLNCNILYVNGRYFLVTTSKPITPDTDVDLIRSLVANSRLHTESKKYTKNEMYSDEYKLFQRLKHSIKRDKRTIRVVDFASHLLPNEYFQLARILDRDSPIWDTLAIEPTRYNDVILHQVEIRSPLGSERIERKVRRLVPHTISLPDSSWRVLKRVNPPKFHARSVKTQIMKFGEYLNNIFQRSTSGISMYYAGSGILSDGLYEKYKFAMFGSPTDVSSLIDKLRMVLLDMDIRSHEICKLENMIKISKLKDIR